MIFVDTSAFFGLAFDRDPYHLQARELAEGFVNRSESLATHNYVVVESFALLHKRLGFPVARQFYRDVYQMCRILWVSQSQHERAAKTYVDQEGSRYSFVDCVSFEIMKTHGIKRYFAFDDDFRRRGFEPASD